MSFALRRSLGLIGRVLPPVALAACLWLLLGRLSALDPGAIMAALAATPPVALIAAGLATAASFAMVGGFEMTLRRIVGAEGPRGRALRAGLAGVAISQTAGFGALTGAFVRWRMLPELGLLRATQLSVAVAVAFMAALGGLTALLLLALRAEVALFLGVAALALALLVRLAPGARTPGLTPGRGLAVLGWTLADVCAGALVLAVLLPADLLPGPAAFLAAYLVALLAGFLSQSPGGLGAFELTLIALLPGVPEPTLIAALLCYRVVYHLIPALAGVALILRAPAPLPPAELVAVEDGARDRALMRAPQGDWALALQGAAILLTRDREAGWLTRDAGAYLVAIGSPRGGARPEGLRRHARSRGLRALLYKAPGRTGAQGRRVGMAVLRIGREAWLNPQVWSAAVPAARGLRRKLRAAEQAGLRIEVAPDHLPMMQMATLAALWSARNGGECGFSMGRFDPVLLRHALVVLAWHEGRLAGFVTFNRARAEWALDLMRLDPDAPDGTMFALVAGAIGAARAQGLTRLSLAAVPQPPGWLPGALARRLSRPGLAQFKAAFAPRWRPLYLVAESRLDMLAGLLRVARAIHHPSPLPDPRTTITTKAPERQLSQNRFEIGPSPCHAQAQPTTGLRAVLMARGRPSKGPQHDQRPFPPA